MPDDAPDPDPDEVAAFSKALEALLRVYRLRDRDAACYGDVSPNQCHALEAVVRHGALRINDLAAELGLHKSNASRVAGGLVARGYLASDPEPGDSRAVRLRITPEGRRAHGAIRGRVDAGLAALLARQPRTVRRGATRLLGALAADAAARFGLDAARREACP
jgi:DNA-binding MarR family transcriptional regulator